MEIRSQGEIRKTEEMGVVSAYLTRWGSVDDYRSRFVKGAFAESFSSVKNRIRLVWNHTDLAGKVLEAKEDDYGPQVRVKFNLETVAGREAFSHVRHGDVDCFSFGFYTLKDRWKEGIREITSLRCVECGPVIFPANLQARIMDVRSKGDDREMEITGKSTRLLSGLEDALEEVFLEFPKDDWPDRVNDVLTGFHESYLDLVNDHLQFRERKIPAEKDFVGFLQEIRSGIIRKSQV